MITTFIGRDYPFSPSILLPVQHDAEGWERGPYWLDGLVPLAFLLGDACLRAKVERWVDYILGHQHIAAVVFCEVRREWAGTTRVRLTLPMAPHLIPRPNGATAREPRPPA